MVSVDLVMESMGLRQTCATGAVVEAVPLTLQSLARHRCLLSHTSRSSRFLFPTLTCKDVEYVYDALRHFSRKT